MTYSDSGQPYLRPNLSKRLSRAYTVGDDVGVAAKASLRVTVGLVVSSEVPDDQGLVATRREQHVRAINCSQNPLLLEQTTNVRLVPLLLERGRQGGNPAIVALEGSTEDQLLSHDRESGEMQEPRDGGGGGGLTGGAMSLTLGLG